MKDDLLTLFIDSSDDFIYEINLSSPDNIIWHKNISEHLNYPNEKILSSVKKLISKLTKKDKEKFQERFTNKTNKTIHFEIEDFYGRKKNS